MDGSGYARHIGEGMKIMLVLAIFGIVVGVFLTCGLVGAVIGGIVALATWSIPPLYIGASIGLSIGVVICAGYGLSQLVLNWIGRR
jgi:hypothetical protein